MAAFVDFSALTPDQMRLIQEMVFDQVINNPEFNLIHSMYSGVRAGDRIGFVGEMGLMMRASQGCHPLPGHHGVDTDTLLWTPNKWEVLKAECGADFDQNIKQWMLNFGNKTFDRSGTEYEAAIAKVLADGMIKNMWRAVWMNDKAAAHTDDSPAGVITPGTYLDYFDWLDGLFLLFYALCAGTPARHSALVGNSQATYALQESVFTPAECAITLNSLETIATPQLRQTADKFILCTKSFEDRYRWSLEAHFQEPAYTLLTNGQSVLSFRGIPLIPIPFWDQFIRTYEDDGTRWNDPHRAILTTKANLAVGTQDTNLFSTFKMWYENKDRENYVEAIGDIDVHVMRPFMFQFAY